RVKEDWYTEVISEITLEKWCMVLKESKNTSAPGPLGIGYRLIKQAGLYAQGFFKQMANKCLMEGDIPDK
ncbi:36639_t:CDS:1, partial [Gigaspora margarita]